VLTGARVDKITQPSRSCVQLSLRQPGENKLLYISIQPQNPILHLLSAPLENPAEPPTFCMVLRKQLETGRIAEIRQHELDRIVMIDIDMLAAGGRIVTKTLVLELMGKYSNLMLVQEGTIVEAMRRVGSNSSRVRLVLPGEPYTLPPAGQQLNLLRHSPAEITAALQQLPDLALSKALTAACVGCGPVTAKEIAFCSGLDASLHISEMDAADFLSIQAAIREVTTALTDLSASSCLLLDKNKKILAQASFPLHYLQADTVLEFVTANELQAKASKLIGSYVPPDKDRFLHLVHNELSRCQKKLLVLQQEAEAAENAEQYRIMADNLMTYQYTLTDHADKELTVIDIYSSDGNSITIPLDQRLTVNQNIQAMYHRYSKLKRGQGLTRQQIDTCREELQYLESIEASLLSSVALADIADIKRELINSGYLKEAVKKKIAEKQSKPLQVCLPDGSLVLIGKNNYQNDYLTFKLSQPEDIWLHTKDIPGSHVLLRTDGVEPSEEQIFLAASLAAHFSKAAGSSKVPVDYTFCRYVKKPSGSRPGFVIFTRQKTLYVTPDEEQLQKLILSSE